MRCEGCDRELPEGAQFCARCGTPAPALARAAELVEMARTSGLAQTSGMADVPEVPEPAEMPAELLTSAEPPEIPEPAPLSGEGPDMAMPVMPVMPAPVVPSSVEARATLERYRREAAQLLAGSAAEEVQERVAETTAPEHMGMGGAPQGRMTDLRYEEGARLPPSPQSPPPPPVEEEARPEHVAMGERSLTASMVRPRARQPAHGDLLAESLRPRSAEEVRAANEPTSGKCCAYGCIVLAIMLALLMLGMLWLQQAETKPKPRPSPSTQAPAAIERMIAQADDTPTVAPGGYRGMMVDAQERQRAHSSSRADGRMPEDVLHQLRQADAR